VGDLLVDDAAARREAIARRQARFEIRHELARRGLPLGQLLCCVERRMPLTEVPLQAGHHVLDNERWIEVARRHVKPRADVSNEHVLIHLVPTDPCFLQRVDGVVDVVERIFDPIRRVGAPRDAGHGGEEDTKSLRRASPFSAQELAE
jgi:hypothetical protein